MTAGRTRRKDRRGAGRWIRVSALALGLAALARSAALAQDPATTRDLAALSIEELMSIDVTSASKHEERLFQVPAAVFVLTREDLRRSGVLTIPDALRMVPGMNVAQIDSNKWEVSARGFNQSFGNKLLVLIDGRIVYTHLTSGVNWDEQDVVLEDVDRIEVIRGPGATLWGANAVNGVINIITRSSRDTQGALVTVGAGNLEKVFGTARFGGSVGEHLTYRIFAKGFSRTANDLPDRTSGMDAWDSRKTGLRLDWHAGADRATLEGEVYRVRPDERISEVSAVTPPFPVLFEKSSDLHGGFGSLLFSHEFSLRSTFVLSASYDVRMRDEFALTSHEEILDLSLQHNFAPGSRQRIVWGLGYRRTTERLVGGFTVSLTPDRDVQGLLSGFAQDDVTLVEGRFHAIAGLKIERYDRQAATYQPNLRFLWTPTPRQTVWASVARALRTPARVEEGIRSVLNGFSGPDGTSNLVIYFGNPDLRQESVIAYEAGYRIEPTSTLSLDLAAFYNRYDRLFSPENMAPFFETDPGPPHVVIPIRQVNGGYGATHGAELSANWNPAAGLRLRPAVTWLETDLHTPLSSQTTPAAAFGDGARFQASLRTALDLPHAIDLDLNVYHVGQSPLDQVQPYTKVDFVAGWRPRPAIELTLGIRNLFDRRSLEVLTTTDGVQTTVTGRSVYGKTTWRF